MAHCAAYGGGSLGYLTEEQMLEQARKKLSAGEASALAGHKYLWPEQHGLAYLSYTPGVGAQNAAIFPVSKREKD